MTGHLYGDESRLAANLTVIFGIGCVGEPLDYVGASLSLILGAFVRCVDRRVAMARSLLYDSVTAE